MSVDTHVEHAHHEPVEVVDHRQRMGLWIFIAGDVVTLGALLFTYLYLRGTNTGGNWTSLVGFDFTGMSADAQQNAIDNLTPTRVYESAVSAPLNWAIVAVVIISAIALWFAETRLRAKQANGSMFSPLALVATVTALVACGLEVVQMRDIPQYFAVHNDSQLFVHTAYGSAMLALGGALIIHLLILAFLGLGLVVRRSRGVVSTENWFQVRLVRIFWVWIGISTIVTAAVTTIFH